jgi:charged multivesicular body protein 7
MGAYMYNFRPKQLNPEYYEQKMKFWKDMMEHYCDYKGSATVTISELMEVFRRKGTSPHCLQTVFDQMTQEANLINKQSFMEVPEKTWSGWALKVVTTPLSWGLGKLKEKLISTSDDNTSFVVKSAVIVRLN